MHVRQDICDFQDSSHASYVARIEQLSWNQDSDN